MHANVKLTSSWSVSPDTSALCFFRLALVDTALTQSAPLCPKSKNWDSDFCHFRGLTVHLLLPHLPLLFINPSPNQAIHKYSICPIFFIHFWHSVGKKTKKRTKPWTLLMSLLSKTFPQPIASNNQSNQSIRINKNITIVKGVCIKHRKKRMHKKPQKAQKKSRNLWSFRRHSCCYLQNSIRALLITKVLHRLIWVLIAKRLTKIATVVKQTNGNIYS